MTDHCSHCPGPDDLAHMDPQFAKAEAQCAFYEDPAHLVAIGPGRRHPKDHLTEVITFRISKGMLERATQAAEADERGLSGWLRGLVSDATIRRAREQRPTGLIGGSARRGKARALGSTRTGSGGSGGTASCEHMSVGNVVSASCGECGPLPVTFTAPRQAS